MVPRDILCKSLCHRQMGYFFPPGDSVRIIDINCQLAPSVAASVGPTESIRFVGSFAPTFRPSVVRRSIRLFRPRSFCYVPTNECTYGTAGRRGWPAGSRTDRTDRTRKRRTDGRNDRLTTGTNERMTRADGSNRYVRDRPREPRMPANEDWAVAIETVGPSGRAARGFVRSVRPSVVRSLFRFVRASTDGRRTHARMPASLNERTDGQNENAPTNKEKERRMRSTDGPTVRFVRSFTVGPSNQRKNHFFLN